MMELDDTVLICEKCDHGREVCTFCAPQEWAVFKMICDCGLAEHGEHRIACEIVTNEAAHIALGRTAITDAESEAAHSLGELSRGPARPVDWGPVLAGWTDEDDQAIAELLDD